ncbi:hypothetical protein ACLOJK_016152 [Asimina triloba]
MDPPPREYELCTSASSEDVNSAEIRNTTGTFTPDVAIELKPKIGMEFASLDEAFDFYNTYGWHSGFSVRKDNTRTLKTGEISRRDASRCCRFFRWLDEMGQSMSGVDCVSHVQSESSAHKTEDIVADFGDLVCCVDTLKNSHLKEARKWKQSHMAMKEDIRELKGAALRRDIEARVMKKTLATVICILVAIICYLTIEEFKDEEVVAVKSLEFMETDIVAVVGQQSSVIAHVISHVANELQVPLLSFAATDPSLSSLQYPFFLRTTQSDLFQMSAIAEIIEVYRWKNVIAVFIDDDYGRNGISALGDKLAENRCKISFKSALSIGA